MKAVYIRTSTEEQNPENQIKDIESISGKDYILYQDKQSAWKEDNERPEFEKLIKEIKGHKVNDIFVWDFDRIYRRRLKLVDFFKLCKAYKVNIHSQRQAWLEDLHKIPSPWNEIVMDMLIQILGWLAEEESTKKSQRVKAAMRVREDGTYSYKGNKWGRKKLSTYKMNLIKESIKRVPKPSIRAIAKEVNVSIGGVHKYLTLIEYENKQNMDSS